MHHFHLVAFLINGIYISNAQGLPGVKIVSSTFHVTLMKSKRWAIITNVHDCPWPVQTCRHFMLSSWVMSRHAILHHWTVFNPSWPTFKSQCGTRVQSYLILPQPTFIFYYCIYFSTCCDCIVLTVCGKLTRSDFAANVIKLQLKAVFTTNKFWLTSFLISTKHQRDVILTHNAQN